MDVVWNFLPKYSSKLYIFSSNHTCALLVRSQNWLDDADFLHDLSYVTTKRRASAGWTLQKSVKLRDRPLIITVAVHTDDDRCRAVQQSKLRRCSSRVGDSGMKLESFSQFRPSRAGENSSKVVRYNNWSIFATKINCEPAHLVSPSDPFAILCPSDVIIYKKWHNSFL